MTRARSSPRRWRWVRWFFWDTVPGVTDILDADGEKVAQEVTLADARLIVRAVNAHRKGAGKRRS